MEPASPVGERCSRSALRRCLGHATASSARKSRSRAFCSARAPERNELVSPVVSEVLSSKTLPQPVYLTKKPDEVWAPRFASSPASLLVPLHRFCFPPTAASANNRSTP